MASSLLYIDAVSSQESPWFNFQTPVIQSLDALTGCDGIVDCADICNGNTIVDECGICGGQGIENGECDCVRKIEY